MRSIQVKGVSNFRFPVSSGKTPQLHRGAAPLFQNLPENSKVLFIRIRNLGEAVLDTANLRLLKKWRPDLQVTTLVEEIYTELYADDSEIDAIPLMRSEKDRRSSFRARLKMIGDIRRRKFDAVVNLHGGPTSAQLTLLSGARVRVGASHFRNGFVYNVRVPPVDEILAAPGIRNKLHTVETQHAWFRWLGLPEIEPGKTRLSVSHAMVERAEIKLRDEGLDPAKPYVVIAPTNEFFTKRWPPERFAVIADNLISRGYQVLVTSAPSEEQRVQLNEVQAATSSRLFGLSNLSIGELVAVIANSRLFVGNDSGPAHIAAAVGTPLVVLFGPASSVRWRPWTADSELVQNYFPCNPCSMYKCDAFDKPECILSITIDQVWQAIGRLI